MVAELAADLVLAGIVAMYRTKNHDAVALGDACLSYRREYGVSYQEMALRSGITPGTIHHYESVAAPPIREHVASGRLTFKEGRALADIAHDRRLSELIELFVSEKLSSVHVERVVYNAKRNPQLTVDEIVLASVHDRKALKKFEPNNGRVKRAPVTIRADDIERNCLSLAGHLDGLRMTEIPEYRRLKLQSALAILAGRVTNTLAWLEGKPLPGQARLT